MMKFEKDDAINVVATISGFALLLNSARVKNNKVVWNMFTSVPATVVMFTGAFSMGERSLCKFVNTFDLYNADGDDLKLILKRKPLLKFKK